jgi:hypothetical protein
MDVMFNILRISIFYGFHYSTISLTMLVFEILSKSEVARK